MRILKYTFILFLISFLIGCDSQKNIEELIENAQLFEQKGNLESSILLLKKVIRQQPENSQARFLLGKLYLNAGLSNSSEKELKKALIYGYSKDEAIPLLANAHYQSHNTVELENLYDDRLEFSNKTQTIVLVYNGLHSMYLGNRMLAEQQINLASDIIALSPYSQLGKAWLISKNSPTDALLIVEELIKDDEKFSDAVLLRAHLLYAIKDYTLASAAYGNYIEQHPFAYDVAQFEANSLIAEKKFEQAEKIIDGLLKLFPNHGIVNQQKARLLYERKNYSEAEEYANITLNNVNKSVPAALISAASAFHLKKFESSYNILRQIEKDLPLNHPAKRIYAILQLELGYAIESSKTFEQLEGLSLNDNAFLQTASLELWKSGEDKSAKETMLKAATLSPTDPFLMTKLGAMKLKQGDVSGQKDLEKSLQLDPTLARTNFALAFYYLENEQYDKTKSLVENWKSKDKNVNYAFVLEGIIFSKQAKHKLAKKAFTQAVQLDQTNLFAKYYLAVSTEFSKEFESAKALYQAVISKQPNNTQALSGLIRTSLALKQQQETITYLKNLQLTYPNNLELIKTIVKLLLSQEKTKEAVVYIEEFSTQSKDNVDLLDILAELYSITNKSNKAIEVYSTLQTLEKRNVRHWIKSLNIFASEKNAKGGLLLANEAINIFPENKEIFLLKANFELLIGDLVSAEKSITKIEGYNRTNYYFVKAHIAMRKKDFSIAVNNFGILFSADPNKTNLLNLLHASKLSNETSTTTDLLEKIIAESPEDYATELVLADFYSDLEQWTKAKLHYQNVIDANPNNYVALNNLAITLFELAEYSQAHLSAEKAYSIKMQDIQIIDTYAYSLLKTSQKEKGLALLDSLYSKNNSDIGIAIHYAEALIMNNRSNDAITVLVKVQTSDDILQSKIQQLISLAEH